MTFRDVLDKWDATECLRIDGQESKINELSQLRSSISDAFERVKAIQLDVDQLYYMLLQQNVQNAKIIYQKRLESLRIRATNLINMLGKIKMAGKQMNGNETDTETDFIEALAQEMPQVEMEM